MARGKAHSDEVKAQVLAALLAGQGVSEVAARYKLPKATVSRIKATIAAGELEQVGTKKKEQIGDLLVNYLTESLTTLSVQQKHFRDKKWLDKQDASSLGTLHGIVTDKAIRLLEALEAGGQESIATDEAGDRQPLSVH
jgi:transposase-like protein